MLLVVLAKGSPAVLSRSTKKYSNPACSRRKDNKPKYKIPAA
jgi:hypothetical protein